MEITTKHGKIKIFTDNIDEKAIGQVEKMGNSRLGENAHIRIMPDCHAGKGCTIGTTMIITDKICPNLIGVDIGCGVNLIKVEEPLADRLKELDSIIRKHIPYGLNVHKSIHPYDFTAMKCWDELEETTKHRSQHSLGSLGGGNHFIEGYTNSISVHSGSRNIGQTVANYYQKLAEQGQCDDAIERDLSYLTDKNMQDYLHDMKIIQQFAVENRKAMLKVIVDKLNLNVIEEIVSTHNFIDTDTMILRKGAISAQEGEILVIPLNMRDGVLVCKGKGNEDWNHSAPHGAGRLYSRTRAKELITLDEYRKSMEGIYSTCVHASTIDESPFAYKKYKEIIRNIEPTVEIMERLKPIFNFKAK